MIVRKLKSKAGSPIPGGPAFFVMDVCPMILDAIIFGTVPYKASIRRIFLLQVVQHGMELFVASVPDDLLFVFLETFIQFGF